MSFAKILKDLRKKSGYTQETLANKLNVSKSTVSMYERGERMPTFETLRTIADIFHVDMNVLYDRDSQNASLSNIHPLQGKKGVKIPVYGMVAAGIPMEAITDIEDYEEISETLACTGEFAALQIHGNSMEPKFSEGDVVIVRLQETIESGEIAIVIVNGGEATCKKIKKTPEGILLISTNPDYEPMFYSNQQIQDLPVRIWGKVVELRAKF